MTEPVPEPKDFFISYNHRDEEWATWIAWALEEAGYSTIIQAWDFRPGTNFALEMDEAVRNSPRTIAVLSESFMASTFTAPEWAAAFATDPNGGSAKLVPVRVKPCDVDGLLGQVVRIDLVGRDSEDAKQALLAGLEVGRAKPLTPPAFPGTGSAIAPARPRTSTPPSHAPIAPATSGLDWQPLTETAEIQWFRIADSRYSSAGATVLELQLLPIPPARIEVRRLRALEETLTEAARASGVITSDAGVTRESNGQLVHVSATPNREVDAGLVVRRDGQRGGWLQLPHDSMGSVLDREDVRPRVAALLRILTDISIDRPERVAIGVRVGPATMLTIGNADVVGRRSNASFSFSSRENETVDPDDTISFAALVANIDNVAEEIVARIIAQIS